MRLPGQERAFAAVDAAIARPAAETSAELSPQQLEQTQRICIWPEHAEVTFSITTTSRHFSRKTQAGKLGSIPEIVLQPGFPVTATRIVKRDLVHDPHLRQLRLGNDADHMGGGVGNELQLHRLEVDEQRIGRGVVRTHRLIVHSASLCGFRREIASIEHEIPADVANAARAQLAQEEPEPFERQRWITMSLQNQITGQHAPRKFPRGISLRGPGIGGSEQPIR